MALTPIEKEAMRKEKAQRRQQRAQRLAKTPFICKYVRLLILLDLLATGIFGWLDGRSYLEGNPQEGLAQAMAFLLENALVISLILGVLLLALSLFQILRNRKGLVQPAEKMGLYHAGIGVAVALPLLSLLGRGIVQFFL